MPVVPGLDDAARRRKAIGMELARPPADRPWGMRDLRVNDADGYVLVVGAAIQT